MAMQGIFLKVAEMSLSAGIFIGVIIVLRPILNKIPPRFRCLLWAAAGVGLVCPFRIRTAVGLLPYGSPGELGTKTGLYQSLVTHPVPPEEEIAKASGIIQTNLPGFDAPPLITILTAVWIAGIAVFAVYGLVSSLKLRLRLRESVETQKRVYKCDDIKSPFVFGWINPVVYLPSGLKEETERYAVLHEKAHIRRKDNLWKAAGFVVFALHWFNPLVWAAYILFCRDTEAACDELVIRKLSTEERVSYSQALLDCSTGKRRMAIYPVAFGDLSVKKRIEGVLSYKKPSALLMAVSAVLCALIILLFMTAHTDTERKDAGGDGFSLPFNHTAFAENRDGNGNLTSVCSLSYDNEGRLVEQTTRDGNTGLVISKREYLADDRGWISDIKEYDSEGNLVATAEYTRGEDGRELACRSVYADGTFCWWNEYSYDEEGNPVGYTRYNEDGTVICTWDSTFDDSGLEKKRVCRDSSGEEEWTQIFNYNSQGGLTSTEKYSPEGGFEGRTDYLTEKTF